MMDKYRNVKTEIDGIIFDSKKEAYRWCELKLMEKAGVIKNLERQKRYEIVPKTDKYRAAFYVADFSYFDVKTGKVIYEDVKGMKTGPAYQLFKTKQKFIYWKDGIEIREV